MSNIYIETYKKIWGNCNIIDDNEFDIFYQEYIKYCIKKDFTKHCKEHRYPIKNRYFLDFANVERSMTLSALFAIKSPFSFSAITSVNGDLLQIIGSSHDIKGKPHHLYDLMIDDNYVIIKISILNHKHLYYISHHYGSQVNLFVR